MSANQLRVNELLNLLAGRAGLGQLKLNDLGICTFQFGNGMHFVVELPPGTDVIYLMAPLARISENKDEAYALYRRALKANYRGEETGGATLTLHEALNHIVLWRSAPVISLDGPVFIQMVEQFLSTAIRLAPLLDHAGGEPATVKKSEIHNSASAMPATAKDLAGADASDSPVAADEDGNGIPDFIETRHYMA
ncbi:MAG: type III secretion system chaperone [Candidatus Methylacidiphilales bacterium]|nr:type III secretion system chaperone [Candidatus Methylacidiphilales bacterium]